MNEAGIDAYTIRELEIAHPPEVLIRVGEFLKSANYTYHQDSGVITGTQNIAELEVAALPDNLSTVNTIPVILVGLHTDIDALIPSPVASNARTVTLETIVKGTVTKRDVIYRGQDGDVMNTKTVYLVPTTTFEGEPTIAPLGSATGRRLRVYTDDPHSIVEHPVGEPSFILVCIGSYLDKRDRVTFNDNHELEFEKNMIKAVAVFERPGGSQPSQPNVTWT